MSASPLSKREQPYPRFEDYIVTYEVGPNAGLFPISSDAMQYVPNSFNNLSYNDPSKPGVDDGWSYVNLGFSFKFENMTYDNVLVDTNGFCILIDPAYDLGGHTGGFGIIGGVLSADYNNQAIYGQFSLNHLLLSAWHDDLRTTYRTVEEGSSSGYYSILASLPAQSGSFPPNDPESMKSGKIIPPPGIDPTLGGIKYFRTRSSNGSKCVVFRWKCFSSYSVPINMATFDIVIYESGDVEYRYIPKLSPAKVSYESATIGVFAYGGSFETPPRYRDFGPYMKKDAKNPRPLYVNGGYVYNGDFYDTDSKGVAINNGLPPDTKCHYTATLNLNEHWPGLEQFGAIFRFSPPRNRRKQSKSIVTLRDSTPFIRTSGTSLFDDRNTIPFVTQGVEYPSMLPSGYKLTSNSSDPSSVTEMYQSGSIVVNRVFTPGLYDSVINDSIIEGRKRRGQ